MNQPAGLSTDWSGTLGQNKNFFLSFNNTINPVVARLCNTRLLTGDSRQKLSNERILCFSILPHWWETAAGWRQLRSRADSNTPHLDGQNWKVVRQGAYCNTQGIYDRDQ